MQRGFRFLLFVFSLLVTGFSAHAQDSTTRAFRYCYENDLFNYTDYYYTQGGRMELALPVLRKNPVNRILFRLPHGRDEEFGVSFSQECFTATIIGDSYIRYGDRPYAGTIFLGAYRVSYNAEKRLRLSSELNVGGIGPCAFCEEMQEGLHELLDNTFPHGWRHQVKNDVVLNTTMRLEKQFVFSPYFVGSVQAQAKLGTLYTNGGGGFGFRAGFLPAENAIPHDRRLRAWLYARGEAYAIGYNATLQGGLFNNGSVYTISAPDVTRVLVRGDAGVVVAWKRLQFEFAHTWITPEFRGGMKHSWGRCTISTWF